MFESEDLKRLKSLPPLDKQIGGDHYRVLAVQPIEYITKNKLDFCEGNIVKYISRHRLKGKAEDIEKVKTVIFNLFPELKITKTDNLGSFKVKGNPETIKKEITDLLEIVERNRPSKENISSRLNTNLKDASKDDLYKISKEIEKEMHVAADLLEFEVAARLRDELKEIKKEIMELPN